MGLGSSEGTKPAWWGAGCMGSPAPLQLGEDGAAMHQAPPWGNALLLGSSDGLWGGMEGLPMSLQGQTTPSPPYKSPRRAAAAAPAMPRL